METAIHSFRQFFRFPITKGGGEIATNPTIYTAAGVIAITPGLHRITGTAKAMALPAPTAAQEGFVLTIYSFTPAAHTVTAAGGFGADPVLNEAVFDADAKSALVVMAVNLNWVILSAVGIIIQ